MSEELSVKKEKKSRRRILLCIGVLLFLIALCAGFLVTRGMIETKEPGWHEENGAPASYVSDEGEMVTGYQIIGKEPFLFSPDGKLITTAGWYDVNGKPWTQGEKEDRFYCEEGGELATGWKYIDGKVWYFYQKEDLERDDAGEDRKLCAVAKNYTTTGGIPIPESGFVDGDKGLALAYGIDVLNRYGWTLKDAYKYSSSLRFVAGADEHYGLTIHSCALHGFKYGEGNCLAWSGTFCVMAKLLGYDCRQIWGTLQWKGTRPHAWTEIWEEDGPHVYDPRKHEGVDMAGFDVHYGDKGSYKYDEDSKQYLEW